MVPIKKTKDGRKGKCPICDKYVELYYSEVLDLMVLECCGKKWSLFPIKTKETKKRKRTKAPTERPAPPKKSKDNADLLKNLKDYHYGKKDE